MKTHRLSHLGTCVLCLVGLLGNASALTNLHTFTYHQLTTFSGLGVNSYGRPMALSADGSRIIFDRPTLSNPATNLIYSVNFDGSGLTIVDAWPGSGYANVDCSANGSQIISFEPGILRIASPGSDGRQLLQINNGYPEFRLSADGTKVFFSIDRSFTTVPDTGVREPGIYVVDTGNPGLDQVAGLSAFATFLGLSQSDLTPSGFLPGWNGGHPYGMSADGSRIVCSVWTPSGSRLLAVSGGNLRELHLDCGPSLPFTACGVSGDGSRVFYYFQTGPCCTTGEELGVFNWDGSGRRVLLSTCTTNQNGAAWSAKRIMLNASGSKLIFGETGWLFNTDSSEQIEIDWNARFASTRLLAEGLKNGGAMDAAGRRFVFLTTLASSTVDQLATVEIDAADTGAAPAVSSPACTPSWYVIGSNSPVLSFRPSLTNALVPGGGAQAGFLYKNILDPCGWQGSTLHDDGTYGDSLAGDGLYSDSGATFATVPPEGYRMLRFKAEVVAADGLYHSHAVDAGPCFILSNSPSGPGPSITFVTPSNAIPGASVVIHGSGFNPVASNNFVLFGNQPAEVLSSDPAGTQLTVIVPIDSPLGAVPVSVSSLGQTSASFTVPVSDPLAAWLGLSRTTGVGVWGAVSQTYRLEATPSLSPASWVPITNLFLNAKPTYWADPAFGSLPTRFYRAIRVP